MNFTSLIFVVFLLTTWTLYWLVPRVRYQNTLIVVASYIFYGYWDYRFCVLMLASCMLDFGIGLAIQHASTTNTKKVWLTLSLAHNLGVLALFKYFGFFLESFQSLLSAAGINALTGTWEIVLPVGISFYTFQSLSYTIDIYRGQLTARKNVIDYLAFLSFFPQLVAGPIERAANLLPQFEQTRRFADIDYVAALERMLWGFFKKIVIADTLAVFVVRAYSNPSNATGLELLVATIFFAFQIYCDFSGYSDIAVGTAELFRIRLMRNFAYPYFSQNLREFWLRWHISLSTWFRDYVYIPLGGNRVSEARQRWNLFVTFLLSGFWHGAAWQYLAWGAIHGFASGIRRKKSLAGPAESASKILSHRVDLDRPAGDGLLPTPSVALRIAATFLVICLTWVFFRASSISDAWLILSKIAQDTWSWTSLHGLLIQYQANTAFRYACHLLIAFIAIEWIRRHSPHPLAIAHWPQPVRWSICSLVLWFVIEHADKTPSSPFVYFQF